MKVGYVHPYHATNSPVFMSNSQYLNLLMTAVGPEQVSPHYETLTRSRRGLLFIFAYFGSITTISRFGGWEHNDWLRGMIWHHEYMIAYFIGFSEIRHFSFFPGPKFSVFYNVYTNYEFQQMCNQWSDNVEMYQTAFLRHTKEQLEYNRIDREYEFVKKRAVVNFVQNSKLNADAHFHSRCVSMLNQIQYFEQSNLKNTMKGIVDDSTAAVFAKIEEPDHKEEIKRGAFEAALNGIRSGVMTYEGDKVLPMIQAEIDSRLTAYKGLSAAEESALL